MAKTVSYTINNLDKVIKQIDDYQKNLKTKINLFRNRLGARGYEVVRARISSMPMPYSMGRIESSVMFNVESNTVVIKCDNNHAVFVEFGTGQFGNATAKGTENISYVLGGGENNLHNLGWVYKSDDGQYYYTRGMESRPFMHESFVSLCSEIESIAREVFK